MDQRDSGIDGSVDLNPFMYVKDKMMCLRVDEATERSSKKNRTDLIVVDDISEFYAEENAKIMFRMPEELMAEVVDYVGKHPSSHFKAFKTQTTMLEFTDQRVSKAVALEPLLRNESVTVKQGDRIRRYEQ